MLTFPFTLHKTESGYSSAYSVNFDGINDWVNIGYDTAHSFGDASTDSPFSLSFWLAPADAPTNVATTVGKWGASSGEWAIETDFNNNKATFLLGDNSKIIVAQTASSNASLSTAGWNLVVGTYDGTGGSSAHTGMNLYINNSLDNASQSTHASYVAMHEETTGIWIGTNGTGSSWYTGNVDEVAIWNKELSSGEVASIWNGGAPGNLQAHSAAANLVSWWKMGDDDTFPILLDMQSVKNGTMTNMDAGDIEAYAP